MDKMTLKEYRCFHDKQEVRLAPLTLLVGENSTGKTSFMAMVRALWDAVVEFRTPDFKEAPYDLGSFDEIAHHRGAKGGRAETFEAGFDSAFHGRNDKASKDEPYRFEVAFGKRGTTPVPVRRRFARGDLWLEEFLDRSRVLMARGGTHRGAWERRLPSKISARFDLEENPWPPPFVHFLRMGGPEDDQTDYADYTALSESPDITAEDLKLLNSMLFGFRFGEQRPFASAPVRSKPRRTYDPSRPTPDPEGDYVPMYLANMYFRNKRTWTSLKNSLEDFGKDSGLFDEVSIRPLGKRDSEPFQVQFRKFGGRLKGPQRNLIDVGYGVSQVLPVITELLRPDAPAMFLLQQPEVHLHPSAQAALGTLFCRIVASHRPHRQLVVETHSDHLIDRVRMDVRDGAGGLKPDDVSILYFERSDLNVHIHSLTVNGQGNIEGAPPSYRSFFMKEVTRSLGL